MKNILGRKGFSIVEILVALIVVSVITAALAPVITKKLKASSITVLGGNGGGNNAPVCTSSIPEFKYTDSNGIDVSTNSAYVTTESDASYWKIKFLQSGTFEFTNSDLTIDAFAVGGGGGGGYGGGGGGGGYTKTVASIPIKQNISYVVTVGTGGACSFNGNASSIKKKSDNSNVVTANGGYAGSYAAGGKGGSGGAGSGSNYCKGGAAGVDGSNGGKTVDCGNYYDLFNGGEGQGTTTREFGLSTGTLYSGGGGAGSGQYDATTYTVGGSGGGGAGGIFHSLANTRVGNNGTPNTGGGGGGGTGNSNSGGAGGSGIVIIKGVPIETCTYPVGGGGGGGAVSKSACLSGTYWDEGFQGCKVCSYKTPNCEDCNTNTGVCNMCKYGYDLNGENMCEEAGDYSCGELAVKVTLNGHDYCMTKYNIGDKNELLIPDSVKVVVPGTNCSSTGTQMCCWSGGTTSSACNSANGDYSGCKRTVCDWRAANEICNKLEYQNLSWRLLTNTEWSYLSPLISEYSTAKGNAGLMLCGTNAATDATRCQYHTSNCSGAYASYCYPDYYWSSSDYSYFHFSGSAMSGPSTNYNYAMGTRCIAPLIVCSSGYYSNKDTLGCSKCDTLTPNCKTCHKITGRCNTCKNGYKLNEFDQCIDEEDVCGELSLKINLNGKEYCMTKFNLGDKNELPLSPKVTSVSPGANCPSSSTVFCCWKGGTTSSNCNSVNGDYSGCKRTVCDWRAAHENCQNLSYQGLAWRLPTDNEYSTLSGVINEYSVGKGNAGLMLCDTNDAYAATGSSTQCHYHTSNCSGAYNAYCYPDYYWSSSSYKYFNHSSNKITGPNGNGTNYAMGTRCVAPLVECDKGTYSDIDNFNCKPCEDKTANCEECHKRNGTCTKCKEGYKLDEYNMCITADDPCGEDAMKVNLGGQDYCMTKYNIGDRNELKIPNTVQVVAPGASCTSSGTKMCCWSGGTTSAVCNSSNGDYSGCKRTVCDWRAAHEICDKLDYQDLDWRLPTDSEWANLGAKLYQYSIGKKNSGLMLCDTTTAYTTSGSSSQCQYHTSNCSGAHASHCYPDYYWSSSSYKYFNHYNNVLSGPSGGSTNYAMVTRCVAPLINCNDGQFSDIAKMICESCSIKTPNCKKCHKRNGTCTECQTGYHLDKYNMCVKDDDPCGDYSMKVTLNGQDYCMTKYNLGDVNELPIPATVQLSAPGANCPSSSTTMCCWTGGNTSSACNSINGDYSGCKRTVCDWKAANEACNKLNYQGLSWRLLTNSEWAALGSVIYKYSAGKNNAGLMLCDTYDAYSTTGSSTQCQYHTSNCSGAYSAYCYPDYYWSSSNYIYFNHSSNKITGPSGGSTNYAMGTRCVAPFVNCEAGTYNNAGVCVECNTKIAHCKDCNKYTGECLSCQEGYELQDGKCKFKDDCGALAMKVTLGGKDLCMLKFNLGDKGLTIPWKAGIITGNVDYEYCNPSAQKCCYKGKTAATCSSIQTTYSGCIRTICNHSAAIAGCEALNYNGMKWRLPTNEELNTLKTSLATYSRGKGSDGLMLCDTVAGVGSEQCLTDATTCANAGFNYCGANLIFSDSAAAYLTGGTLTSRVINATTLGSIRCVADI